MTPLRQPIDAALNACSRAWSVAWSVACMAGFRHGPLLVALPLGSSFCLLAFRFVLSACGVPV